jgi:hypothetical protein
MNIFFSKLDPHQSHPSQPHITATLVEAMVFQDQPDLMHGPSVIARRRWLGWPSLNEQSKAVPSEFQNRTAVWHTVVLALRLVYPFGILSPRLVSAGFIRREVNLMAQLEIYLRA